MSKRGYISRYMLIVKKLKAKPYTSYKEIKEYIENQLEFLQMQDDTLNVGSSLRTVQRDFREISNLFGIDIIYSRSGKGYYISQSESENMNFQRMLEAFDLYNSLTQAQDLKPFIHLEKRRPQGTENLYGLIHAIKNKVQVKFTYQKFSDEKIIHPTVEPLALKEFKNRWYLLAKDPSDGYIKSYGLDRMKNLEITNIKFQPPVNFDVEQKFRYCFGIISPNEGEPQDIILSFEPMQGNYIKTLPLHETQKIIKDTNDELQISLKLYITYDFIMELLSFGDSVKVLEPESLIKEIKAAHFRSFSQYVRHDVL